MGATTVTGTILGVDNAALVGVYVTFRLKSTGTDSVATSTIDRDAISVITDASGQFSTTLWDNGDSGVTSILEIRMPSGQRHDVIIPAGDAAIDIWDLIENYTVGTADPQLPTNEALFMRKANNLSDVASVSTARTNLGLGTAATTAATDYATAAQGTLADSALQSSDIGITVQAQSAVLDATTASYTTTEQTKLSGIEDAADVTDAENVETAGAYMVGGTDVAIADGGTGASTEAAARTNLEFQTNVTGAVTAVGVTSYTVLTTDHTLTVDDTAIGGNVTINLPAVATATSGFDLVVKKTGSTYTVTLDGNGAETIDGAATYALTIQNESVRVTCDGTGWNLISTTPLPIETTITDTDNAIPTSGAVVDYAQPADENIAGPTTDVITTSYNVLSSDRVLLVNDTTAGAAVTINLPSAVTIGDGWQLVIKKVGTDYDVTLDADGTETIDGVLTRALHQKNDTFVIVSDGANWEIASRNVVLGWANYVDSTYTSGSPLLLNVGNSYNAQCTVDGLGSGSTQSEWPNGVPEPWDTSTNKLIGTNDGDKFTYELSFKAQDGAASVLMDVYIDIGSPIGEISRSSVSIAKGASVETAIEMYRTYFSCQWWDNLLRHLADI
jgi:hypothetical protein